MPSCPAAANTAGFRRCFAIRAEVPAVARELLQTTGTPIHRLSTIRHADKIVVLHEGEIVEEGTHQQLIDSNKHYKKLYDLQDFS